MIKIENSRFKSFASGVAKKEIKEKLEEKKERKEHTENATIRVNSKNKGSYCCEFCQRPFSRKDRLERHRFTHTGIKQFKCKYEGCNKEYSNDSHLRRHLRTSHEMKPQLGAYICKDPKCGQQFTNLSNMHRHFKQKHYLNYFFPCTECDEHFRRKFRLKEHLIKVHNIGDHKHVCVTCDKGFFNLPSYAKHVASHKPKERRPCENCELTFLKWTDLVKHRRDVHKIKQTGRFFCDLCPRTFTWRKSLKIHMRVHQTQRTVVFKCIYPDCHKQYTTKSNLKAHVRSKHEGKNFNCPQCNYSLTTRQRYNQHMKIHEEHKQNHMELLVGLQMTGLADNFDFPAPPSKIDVPTESEVSDY